MTDERRIKPTFLERQCPDRRDAPAGFAILAIASLIAIAAILHVAWLGDEVRAVKRVVVMEKCPKEWP